MATPFIPGCFKWGTTERNVDCVMVFQQGACCLNPDGTGLQPGGFARPVWYVIFDPNGTITFYGDQQREEALEHGARLGWGSAICGENCPEP